MRVLEWKTKSGTQGISNLPSVVDGGTPLCKVLYEDDTMNGLRKKFFAIL